MRPVTISRQLKDEFFRRIRHGQWTTAQPIPGEMELATQFKASRTAVRRALKELEVQGLLEATRGSGRRVTLQGKTWTGTIGLLARGSEFAQGQGLRFFTTISKATANRGHSLLLYAFHPDEVAVTLPQRGVDFSSLDGAVLFAPQYRLSDIEQLARDIPVVSTPHDATSVSVPSFVIDYGVHASIAVQELARLGHRRIVLTNSSSPSRSLISAAVRRGFDLGRINAGLGTDPALVLEYGHPSDQDIYAGLYKELRQLKPPATAIISRTRPPLTEIITRARAAGDEAWVRRTSFVCLADLGLDEPLQPKLADFDCDIEKVAGDAVECLDGMIRGRPPQRLLNPYYGKLRPGQTLKRCPA